MADLPSRIPPLESLCRGPVVLSAMAAGQGLAIILALSPGLATDRWYFLGIASLLIQWIVLLAIAVLYLLRRPLARLSPLAIAWTALGALVGSTWLVALLVSLAAPATPGVPGLGWQLMPLTGIALAVGLMGIAAFHIHWTNRQLDLRARQAELEALQARLHPHFLFNTLNTGAALVHDQPEQAERLLLDLSDLFRAALSAPDWVPLADEIGLARRYAEIETLRFGRRMRMRWSVPEPLPHVLVPSLCLQPLVENAVLHGVEPSPDGGDIEVSVQTTDAGLAMAVCNSVPTEGTRRHRGHRIGLASVRLRIESLTGGDGELTLSPGGGSFCASIRLPLRHAPAPKAGTASRGHGGPQPPITR